MSTRRIAALLNGRRASTGEPAFRLGRSFGNIPRFMLDLQALREFRVARANAEPTIEALPTLAIRRRERADVLHGFSAAVRGLC